MWPIGLQILELIILLDEEWIKKHNNNQTAQQVTEQLLMLK